MYPSSTLSTITSRVWAVGAALIALYSLAERWIVLPDGNDQSSRTHRPNDVGML